MHCFSYWLAFFILIWLIEFHITHTTYSSSFFLSSPFSLSPSLFFSLVNPEHPNPLYVLLLTLRYLWKFKFSIKYLLVCISHKDSAQIYADYPRPSCLNGYIRRTFLKNMLLLVNDMHQIELWPQNHQCSVLDFDAMS